MGLEQGNRCSIFDFRPDGICLPTDTFGKNSRLTGQFFIFNSFLNRNPSGGRISYKINDMGMYMTLDPAIRFNKFETAMREQALWHWENIDVNGIFCPQKLGRGEMDLHPHKQYAKGEYVYLQDEDADKIYFLTEGRVKIGAYDAGSGKEITKSILGKGEVFGELAVMGEEKRRDFAYVMEPTTVCVLSVEDMRALMRERNGITVFLMKIIGARVLELEQRLTSMVFKDSRTRVVEYLYQLATKKGRRVGFETLVNKFLNQEEIAMMTATSRQTVNTVLNDLRDKKILKFDRRRMLVHDMERLGIEAAK
jgi:CRP/FNR family transcriptional regulator, cyclic AMP receptor protein